MITIYYHYAYIMINLNLPFLKKVHNILFSSFSSVLDIFSSYLNFFFSFYLSFSSSYHLSFHLVLVYEFIQPECKNLCVFRKIRTFVVSSYPIKINFVTMQHIIYHFQAAFCDERRNFKNNM